MKPHDLMRELLTPLKEVFCGEWTTIAEWTDEKNIQIFSLHLRLMDCFREQRHSITSRKRIQVRGCNSTEWRTVA